MQKGLLKLVFPLTLAAILATSNASAATIECPNCDYFELEARALQQGPGTWTVWNPINGEIGRFRVVCGGTPNSVDGFAEGSRSTGSANASSANSSSDGIACTNRIDEWPHIPADVVQAAQHLSSVHNETSGTYKVGVVIHAEDLNAEGWGYGPQHPTAHDYLLDSNLQGRINDILTEDGMNYAAGTSLAAVLEWLMEHANAALGFTSELEILVTLKFEDDSSVKVVLKLNRPAEHIEGSGRDSDGNVLPEGATSEDQGTWRFNSQGNMDRWVALMERWGANMNGRPRGGYEFTYWSCEWDGGNLSLTCTANRVYID